MINSLNRPIMQLFICQNMKSEIGEILRSGDAGGGRGRVPRGEGFAAPGEAREAIHSEGGTTTPQRLPQPGQLDFQVSKKIHLMIYILVTYCTISWIIKGCDTDSKGH